MIGLCFFSGWLFLFHWLPSQSISEHEMFHEKNFNSNHNRSIFVHLFHYSKNYSSLSETLQSSSNNKWWMNGGKKKDLKTHLPIKAHPPSYFDIGINWNCNQNHNRPLEKMMLKLISLKENIIIIIITKIKKKTAKPYRLVLNYIFLFWGAGNVEKLIAFILKIPIITPKKEGGEDRQTKWERGYWNWMVGWLDGWLERCWEKTGTTFFFFLQFYYRTSKSNDRIFLFWNDNGNIFKNWNDWRLEYIFFAIIERIFYSKI